MAAFAKNPASANPVTSVPTGSQFDNRRVLAGLIDLMVPIGLGVAAGAAGLSLTRGLQVVVLGWALYYCFALESSDGQTLGKRVMKLRVVSADGSPATDAQIAKRTILRIVEWNVIGLIVMVASGERRQRLGDMVAGTVVTDAVASEPAATTEVHEPAAHLAAPPVEKPKRRRGLKDLAKLEIGGSKKKKKADAEAPMVAATALPQMPAVEEPKRRRGLKDLAKLEIGGSKKKKADAEAPMVAATALPEMPAVEEPKRRRRLKDLAKLEIGGSKKKNKETAVEQAVSQEPVEKPKKRRSLKDLAKIEIGGKKKTDADEVQPSAVMAVAPHAGEALPPEALPEPLRPEPEPELRPLDLLDERPVHHPVDEPEPLALPEPVVEHEPVVEFQHEPNVEVEPNVGPEPSVEIEQEPPAYEPVVELDSEALPEPDQHLYEHVEAEPSVEIEREPSVELEREPSVEFEDEPSVEFEREPSVEFEREPSVEIEREPSVEIELEPEVEPMSETPPEPSQYPDVEPTVEIEEPGDRGEPEVSPYAHLDAERSPYEHLNPEPGPLGHEAPSPYSPAEAFAEPEPEPEPETEPQPEPTLYQHVPEPAQEPASGPTSRYPENEAPGTPVPIVKPIETVSAMDLLMQDVEERQSGSEDSDGSDR